MSLRLDRAATDLVARLRLLLIAKAVESNDPVERRRAFAAAGTAMAALATIRRSLADPDAANAAESLTGTHTTAGVYTVPRHTEVCLLIPGDQVTHWSTVTCVQHCTDLTHPAACMVIGLDHTGEAHKHTDGCRVKGVHWLASADVCVRQPLRARGAR